MVLLLVLNVGLLMAPKLPLVVLEVDRELSSVVAMPLVHEVHVRIVKSYELVFEGNPELGKTLLIKAYVVYAIKVVTEKMVACIETITLHND